MQQFKQSQKSRERHYKFTGEFKGMTRLKKFNVKALTKRPLFSRCVRLLASEERVQVGSGGAKRNHSSHWGVKQTVKKMRQRQKGEREREMSTETETQYQRGKERQSTSGHTQLRHGHKWLKADFPFWQAYQSLHSVMEAKVKRAWSTGFASSNHQRDVFKKHRRGREEEGLHREVFTIMVCLNGGYYLFTQLPRATSILFEVILLIFLPAVDSLSVGMVAFPPAGRRRVVTSGNRGRNCTRGPVRRKK